MNTVEVENLKKDFILKKGPLFKRQKEVLHAVDRVNFSLKQGEIFSLLGPNGAGKTTIIKMLSTLLIPSSGTARIMGFDIVKEDARVRRVLTAVLPGERTLFWKLTVRENLQYFGSLYGLDRKFVNRQIDMYLNEFQINEKRDVLVEKLSTGQRQKVVLCRAMLPEPDVIIIDEPTLGLDPVSAKTLRNMIRNIKAIGKTILLTTHYMYEVDELSDRIAIINEGKFVCLDTPERLKKNLQAKQIFRLEVSHWNDAIHQLFGVKHPVNRMNYHRKNGLIQVELELTEENLGVSDVSNFCNANNIFLHQIRIDEPTLEDVFIAKTGKRLEEADADKILA
jgi:ABC-2 type transport system ATP-binding protein